MGCWGSCLDFIIQRSARLRVQVWWLLESLDFGNFKVWEFVACEFWSFGGLDCWIHDSTFCGSFCVCELDVCIGWLYVKLQLKPATKDYT